MATTTLLQRHAGEGETIAEAIRDCLDYGKDPEKTESGKYISAYECDPATVADEFLLAKASYAAMTGREQKKENNVLCYQIRQSFYPGEITPKEANRIGYELAMRWTKGRHAFIVTTHTDMPVLSSPPFCSPFWYAPRRYAPRRARLRRCPVPVLPPAHGEAAARRLWARELRRPVWSALPVPAAAVLRSLQSPRPLSAC